MSSHGGGTAVTTATLFSPIVPHKRQCPEYSPTAGRRSLLHESSPHQQPQDYRWPAQRAWTSRDEKSPDMTRDQPAALPDGDPWRGRTPLYSGNPPSPHDHHMLHRAPCPTCTHAGALVPHLVSGLEDLESELSKLSVSGHGSWSGSEIPEARENAEGLLRSLDYGIERLNQSVQITRDVIAKSQFHGNPPSENAGGPSFGSERTRAWETTDGTRAKSRYSPSTSDGSRRPDLPPLFTDEQRRELPRNGPHESSLIICGTASPPASQGTSIGRAPTPTDSNRSRLPTLPSPASLSVTSSVLLPPMSPSLVGGSSTLRSPQTAHLEDLQHQLSTKTLAHQILSGEHEKLLSAYSRLQTRCTTLDKKSSVSDTEIANLVEERIRLQADLEMADARVDELQGLQEESRKQHAAHGEQYMQIMSLSSQLQAKGAAELKQWKADREAWMAEKDELLSTIGGLEARTRSAKATAAYHMDTDAVSVEQESIAESLRSASPATLSKEILDLRRRLKFEQERVRACQEEGYKLGSVIRELTSIGTALAAP